MTNRTPPRFNKNASRSFKEREIQKGNASESLMQDFRLNAIIEKQNERSENEMKDFYLKAIAEKMQEHPDVFEEIVMDTFGWLLEWKDVEVLSSNELIELMCEMERKIKIKTSPLDIKRLAVAIQFSRSGGGLCAITPFICAFCGKEEEWGNSAVPKICRSCATEMATNMAKQHVHILKDAYSIESKTKE